MLAWSDIMSEKEEMTFNEKDITKEAVDYYINMLEQADVASEFEEEAIKRKVEILKSVKYKYLRV